MPVLICVSRELWCLSKPLCLDSALIEIWENSASGRVRRHRCAYASPTLCLHRCSHWLSKAFFGSRSLVHASAHCVRPAPYSRDVLPWVSECAALCRRLVRRRRLWRRAVTPTQTECIRFPFPECSSRLSKSATRLLRYRSRGGVAVSTSRNRTGVAR